MTNDLRVPNYSHILKEVSGGRANLINIFGDSLAANLAVFTARLRKFIRNRHLDINLPRTLLFLVFLIVAWLMIESTNNCKDCSTLAKKEPLNNYELIKDIGALAGATITILFAMTNMHREYHYKKREKASTYVSAWHSQDYFTIRQVVDKLKSEVLWDIYPTRFNINVFDKCHSVVAGYKQNADGIEILQKVQSSILARLYTNHTTDNTDDKTKQDHRNEKDSVDCFLSFLEHMGQDVKEHVADSDYLKDYFYSIVVDNYELFRKYIEHKQIDRSNRMIYCNIIFLAQTWEKEGNLPELPRICLRPPIVTTEDLTNVYDLKLKDINRRHPFPNTSIISHIPDDCKP